jgi:transposase
MSTNPESTPPAVRDDLERINRNAAGIDVGARAMYVAVPADRSETPVRSFGTVTADLHQIAQWLSDCGITSVAMESTGVYWIPLWEILEGYGIDVILVDARKVKNVSGRKADVSDAQWLQTLHTYGLLAGCFRPEADIRTLRSYLRQRQTLVEARAECVQHMHKALVQMNIQLTQVVTDITGVTGMRIIRAIIAGERDLSALASMRDHRVKASAEKIAAALVGDWRAEHIFALRQAVELYDVYEQKLSECDEAILAALESLEQRADDDDLPPSSKSKPNSVEVERLRRALFRATGVDLLQINGLSVTAALVLISEIGTDMSRWPTEKHFCSWLGLAPNVFSSGGKVLSKRGRKVINRAAQILRMAAHSLYRSNCALGAFYRSLKGRLGPAKAIKATAHRIAQHVYRALRFGSDYIDIGQQEFERRQHERRIKALTRNAQRLGFEIVPV